MAKRPVQRNGRGYQVRQDVRSREEEALDPFGRLVRPIDGYQKRHSWLGFPVAVIMKFGDDRAGQLAALLAYYGFFSVFPLLLALVTILGFILRGNPELQQKIVNSAISQFPIIGGQIRRNLHALTGSVPVLVVGLAGTVWSGMAVVGAAQNAMDQVWNVARRRRPSFLRARLRGLAILAVLGIGFIGSGFLAGLEAASATLSPLSKALAVAGGLALNLAFFASAFRMLTVARVEWREVLPGAAVAAIAWTALQLVGSYLMSERVRGATDVYGFFAVVIGLLSWLYLWAQITLFAAEINVVKAGKLWPRSLTEPEMNEPEKRSTARQAKQ